jgi:hypothetical protein
MLQHPAFRVRPTSAQFAKCGSWETAWSFTQLDSPSRTALSAYLGGAREVAFEVFFGDAFFGVRFEGNPKDVEKFSRHCIESFCNTSVGSEFFEALQMALSWTGLGRNALFTEVGAVNAWKSVGAHRLPPPNQALQDFDNLWKDISQTILATETTHKKAIEFAYDTPAEHWFALPVNASQVSNLLSRNKLKNALHAASYSL